MTSAQKRAFLKYLAGAQQTFGLQNWEITLNEQHANEDSNAEIEVSDNLYSAKLYLSPEFWTSKPQVQREIIAHELLHIMFSGFERAVGSLEETVGSAAWGPFYKFYDTEVERAADAVSRVAALAIPLPEFPKGKDGSK